MNAVLRCLSVVVLLLAMMGSDSAAQPPDPAEKEAVAAIEKLGGKIQSRGGLVFDVDLIQTAASLLKPLRFRRKRDEPLLSE